MDPLAPWDFPLPDELVAAHPPPRRDDARLLVVGDPPARPHADLRVPALLDLLREGDLLVVNDIHVHKARLRLRRATGGDVEVLLLGPRPDGRWSALARPGRRLREGEELRAPHTTPGGAPGAAAGAPGVRLDQREADGSWVVTCHPDVDALTALAGEVPLPPYLGRPAAPEDEARYQTVYATRDGEHRAAAAPTAGLHLTHDLLQALASRGVRRASVRLEVGGGTFRPLDPAQLDRGELHPERYLVPEATWTAVEATQRAGGRVIAVGTTTTRVLESASGPGPGVTRLFLRPGAQFHRVDVLLTNFHLPRSSLLLLVTAFGGQRRVMDAYAYAVAARYRFFSYGDAMLVERAVPPPTTGEGCGPAGGGVSAPA